VGALIGMRQELELDIPRSSPLTVARPIYVAKPGPILLAKKTGHSVNCFYIAVQRAWILNSWDRMIIPNHSPRCAYFSSPSASPPSHDEQMSALHQQMQETLERCRLGPTSE